MSRYSNVSIETKLDLLLCSATTNFTEHQRVSDRSYKDLNSIANYIFHVLKILIWNKLKYLKMKAWELSQNFVTDKLHVIHLSKLFRIPSQSS